MLRVFLLILLMAFNGVSEEAKVRIKDISRVIESRDNQLIGYGLVVGLRNTGDTQRSVFTEKALTNLLKKMGIKPDKKDFKSRNAASVIVTMNLPPYARPGQKLDVSVSSLGDATSLSGGTLLMTPLQGADFKTYAVAQGQIVVGGISGKSSKVNFRKNQTTSGRVPNGAIVEKEVKVTRDDQLNVTLVLNKPDFTMSSKVVKALKNNGFGKVSAVDAGSIIIPIAEIADMPYVDIIEKIENTKISPESTSKVIINSKTGIVVIGENVRLLPVAITHGSISIRIAGGEGDDRIYDTDSSASSEIEIKEEKTKVHYIKPDNSLSSLVDVLNDIGVNTKDLISILQAMEEAGALLATIEVI
ncbi:flagellar biosynthesis protein FlgA [Candidatus Marinamargulisbacteria bacterium SCGC AG-343-K17]|nr:flagellar biosynthesis protein FlgA [Candidatus Marinamargulisbacteria bacterium SCGC AG-343-K17]